MSRRAWFAFAALSVIWGVPYLFIKVAVDGGISPFFLVLGAAGARRRRCSSRSLRAADIEMLLRGPRGWILAYATVEMVGPFPLIAAGEQHVASSVAAIVIATVPLLIALLALRFDHTERPTRTRMLGMLIGLAGVVALVGIDLSGESDELLGAGAVMIAAVGYAAGPMIIKRHLLDYDPRATMAASLRVAAVLLTPARPADDPGLRSARGRDQLPDRARRALHGGRLRDPDGPGLGDRRGARLDHHLHQPGDRRGTRA